MATLTRRPPLRVIPRVACSLPGFNPVSDTKGRMCWRHPREKFVVTVQPRLAQVPLELLRPLAKGLIPVGTKSGSPLPS